MSIILAPPFIVKHHTLPQTQNSPYRTGAWLDTKKCSFSVFVAMLNGFLVAVRVGVSGSRGGLLLGYSEQSGVAASSTFPGVQNLLLAARALGLGSVLTTLHPQVMERVNAMFEVPEEMEFHCCIPIGYPRGKFGPTSRLPTSATTSWDRWGQPPPW